MIFLVGTVVRCPTGAPLSDDLVNRLKNFVVALIKHPRHDAVSQREPQRDAPRVAERLRHDILCYPPEALGAEPQRTRAKPAPVQPRDCPRRA